MTRVLLVDDSPAMRSYISRTLGMTGMELSIHEAENGAAAMETAYEVHPDIVITDLNMPGMSGQELVARIGASSELGDTRVVVLSADRSSGRARELLEAGAAAYLTKPVTPERLRTSLMAILESSE